MLAAILKDGKVSIGERPAPEPKVGEILVSVKAAGVNPVDVLQMAGRYPVPVGAPADIPGLEFAGEVVECGPAVERFSPGDRVMSLTSGGAQAEYAVVHERIAMPVPEELDWVAAGGIPEVYITAADALFEQANLRPGERLLVHAGAGGVGSAAIQLGQMAGARVTATVRSEKAREQVAALGVQAIASEDFVASGPFDVILELVGAPNLAENFEALAMHGRICVISVQAGAKAEIDLFKVMAKHGQLCGSMLRPRPLEDKAAATRLVERAVIPGFISGDLSLPIAATYPLEDVAEAYAFLKRSGKFGKVVLTIGG
jgi:putative PIG3 family NAD(P)H quinone oxidoreductase